MPNIAKILKEEITRLARREIRAQVEKLRKSVATQQRELSTLKSQVKSLGRQASALERATARAPESPAAEPTGKKVRFSPKGLVSTRKRLGLSAADLAKLVGVTAQTIYNWEGGATRPRPEQQAKLVALRSVGKREIRALLAAQN